MQKKNKLFYILLTMLPMMMYFSSGVHAMEFINPFATQSTGTTNEFINPFANPVQKVNKTIVQKLEPITVNHTLINNYSDDEKIVVDDIKKKGGTDQDASEIIGQYRTKNIPISSVIQVKGLAQKPLNIHSIPTYFSRYLWIFFICGALILVIFLLKIFSKRVHSFFIKRELNTNMRGIFNFKKHSSHILVFLGKYVLIVVLVGILLYQNMRMTELEDEYQSITSFADSLDSRIDRIHSQVDDTELNVQNLEGKTDDTDDKIGELENKLDGLESNIQH